MRVSLISIFLVCAASGVAHADTFTWSFASQNVSGSGTLVATADGKPGEYVITGGSGTVTDTTYGTMQVTLPPCTDPSGQCTLVNTDGIGTNLTYDDLLFPGNAPGSQLDGNGIVLTPGFDGSTAIGVWDGPSQEFYQYSNNGYQSLSTPFTVTRVTATPEPASIAMLGTGLVGLASALRRRQR